MDRTPQVAPLRDALIAELHGRSPALAGRHVRSLYFGGGTPSLWEPEAIGEVVQRVRDLGETPYDVTVALEEVTLEINPEDVTPKRAAAWKRAGITRASLGIQSFHDPTLRTLGRAHDGGDARAAIVRLAAAGIADISVDLIYAVPNEAPDRLAGDLDAIAGLDDLLNHVSAYELTFEPGTAFAQRRDAGRLVPQAEGARIAASEAVIERLWALGYRRYEVSSFAKPGAEAVHNHGYWTGDEYLGIGPSAHSLSVVDGVPCRRANAAFSTWLGGAGSEEEILDADTHLSELVFLGARTRSGVNFAALQERFDASSIAPFMALSRAWVDKGLGAWHESRFVLNDRGLNLCDLFAEQALDARCAAGECPDPLDPHGSMTEDNTQTPPAANDDAIDDLFLDADEGAESQETPVEVIDAEVLTDNAPAEDDSTATELEAVREELATTKERLVRKAADLENARRRHQRERDEMTKFAGESVLKDIVPVLDDLERAVAHLSSGYEGEKSMVEGVDMVVRKFTQVLERRGVVAVSGIGKPFDPQFHEAIQQKDDPSVPNNTIVQEFQKGYMLHDRLLRPSLVVVAKGGPVVETPADEGEDLVEEGSSGDDA